MRPGRRAGPWTQRSLKNQALLSWGFVLLPRRLNSRTRKTQKQSFLCIMGEAINVIEMCPCGQLTRIVSDSHIAMMRMQWEKHVLRTPRRYAMLPGLITGPRASASSLYFSASVAFPPDNRFCILLTRVFRGMPCKWSGFSWVLLTLSSDRSHAGPFCWGKKCCQQLLRALLPSKHNRRRWLQPAISSNKTPRNQGRLENRFFSYANIKYQNTQKKIDI